MRSTYKSFVWRAISTVNMADCMNEGIYFLKYRNISIITPLIHTIPSVYRTCGPQYKPLVRTAHDCETGLYKEAAGPPYTLAIFECTWGTLEKK